MKLNITSTLGNFDKDKFLIAVQAHIKAVFIKAMRLFLLAAVPKIPVRTGFARSALRNLEDIAGKVTADKQSGSYRIRGTRGGGSDEKVSRDYYYPPTGGRVLKTSQSGRQFATPTNQILNISGGKMASGRTAFYFKFEVNIAYFDLLDRTVWGAFKAGEQAMESFIKANLNNGFPQVGKFLTRKTT